MKKLRVHGTKPKGHPFPIVSWLIRLFEWSKISHVIVQTHEDRIYHAHFNKVKFENFTDYKQKNEIVYSYEFEIPEEQYEQMLDWCIGYKGIKKGYFKKLFGTLIPQMLRLLFGAYEKNTFVQGMEDNALCSELLRFLALRFWSFKVPSVPHAECFTTRDMMVLMKYNGAEKIPVTGHG